MSNLFNDAADKYNKSDLYAEELKDFLTKYPDEDEDLWLNSRAYILAVKAYAESQADYGGPHE